MKVEIIRSPVPLGLMYVQELLDEEVDALAVIGITAMVRRYGASATAVIPAASRSPASETSSECLVFAVPTREKFTWGPSGTEAGRDRERSAPQAGAAWDLVSQLRSGRRGDSWGN